MLDYWPGNIPFKFPINRCHQRAVTMLAGVDDFVSCAGFQSIGVTSEW